MAKKIKKEDLYAMINDKQSNKSIEDLLRSHASLDALMNTTVQVVNTRIPPETKRTETNAKEETNSIYTKVNADSYAKRLEARDKIMSTNDQPITLTEDLVKGEKNTIPLPASSKIYHSDGQSSYTPLEHSFGLFSNSEINSLKFNRFARHNVFNPNDYIPYSHEILFFTKFDLHITKIDEDGGDGKSLKLIDELSGDAYFRRLMEEDGKDSNYKIIRGLQLSAYKDDTKYNSKLNPFVNLLTFACKGGLNLPSINATTVDTPTNAYGTNYYYRGSGEAEDDCPSFSLEFKDNKNLDVYRFFKTYDKYETLKSHGVIPPITKYIRNKILYDQCGIYKFTLAEDWSRILHYAYYWGAFPTNVPREAFDQDIDNGLSYTIDFKAAFVDDMDPNILVDFNQLTKKLWNKCISGKRPLRRGFEFYRRPDGKGGFTPDQSRLTSGLDMYDFMDNELVVCPHVVVSKFDKNYYLVWR